MNVQILIPESLYIGARQGDPVAYHVFDTGSYDLHILLHEMGHVISRVVRMNCMHPTLLVILKSNNYAFYFEEYALQSSGMNLPRSLEYRTKHEEPLIQDRKVRVR